jgi:hypothetical protein
VSGIFLSSEVAKVTIKEINCVIRKAKLGNDKLRFAKLGELSNLEVKVYADASYANQEGCIKSTAGRFILVQSKDTKNANIICWKTKKLSRVCRSVKTAETRALDKAIDERVNVPRMLKEVYNGFVDPGNVRRSFSETQLLH